MDSAILLGERLRIQCLAAPSGGASKGDAAVAWATEKEQRSNSALNIFKVGTRHHHFVKLKSVEEVPRTNSSLVVFKTSIC